MAAPVAAEALPAVLPLANPLAVPRRRGEGGRTLKETSAHLMLYLHPDAAKALKRYAVDQNTKVHDLSPLRGLPLVTLAFDARRLRGQIEVVRSWKQLESINGAPARNFDARLPDRRK